MKVPKVGLLIASIALVSASCNFLSPDISGGLLKTANGGADWQGANQVKDNPSATMAGLSISAMAFDPTKPERIFASSYNDGVFVSEDGGDTWRRILSKFLVYDIAIHPQNTDTIYAAGIYDGHGRVVVTRDGGKSWNEVFNEASANNTVRSVALNPDNTREVIIGMNGGAIIKSEDEGINWRLVQTYNDRVNKLRWKSGSVYAVIRNSGVYRSTDNGNSFINITSSLTPTNNVVGDLISSAGIGNFNQVAVSDTDQNTIFMTANTGLYRSYDGGASWAFLPLPLRQNGIQVLAVSIAPSDDKTVYASAGSNVYRSSDGGATWQTQDTHTAGQINIILIHPTLPQISYAGIYTTN